jgi:hypothetical protein
MRRNFREGLMNTINWPPSSSTPKARLSWQSPLGQINQIWYCDAADTKRVGPVKARVVTVLILILFLAYIFSDQEIPDGLDGYLQSLADKIRSAANWMG